jgi:Ca2+-binding RTX toxin-like protein
MFGGPGDDTFVWNPGDGSDTIEGQSGQDTLLFNGANVDMACKMSRGQNGFLSNFSWFLFLIFGVAC